MYRLKSDRVSTHWLSMGLRQHDRLSTDRVSTHWLWIDCPWIDRPWIDRPWIDRPWIEPTVTTRHEVQCRPSRPGTVTVGCDRTARRPAHVLE
jgi:hypothetical protein